MTGQLSLSSPRSLSDLRRGYCVTKEQHCWVLLQMLIFTNKGKQFLAFSLHYRSDLREFPPIICPAWVHVLLIVQTFCRIVRERYRWTTTDEIVIGLCHRILLQTFIKFRRLRITNL